MNYSYPRVLLGALVGVLVLAILVAASTSAVAFGVYNPAWDGAGDLRDVAADGGATATIAVNTSAYRRVTPNETVAIVLSPSESYGSDAARLRRFVRRGGTLVVAEDFGATGNDLLQAVGAAARFDGRLLRDDRHYASTPAMPVATNVTGNESLTADVDRLTLNYATVVEPNNATVLVRSSAFAYLDANRNDAVDDGEELQSYPVVTVEQVGNGRVVAVSDPSLFINAMLERPDNRVFAANLFDAERVLLDYSHLDGQPPLSLALLHVRDAPWLQGGLLALFGGLIAVSRRVRSGAASESDASFQSDPGRVARYLARERGWDIERAERLTTGVWGSPSDGEDNE